MALEIINMSETVAPQEVSQETIHTNASLPPEQRLEAAGKRLFGDKLNKEQEEALKKVHDIGKGQPGKDGGEARVGNYTFTQIKEKEKGLTAGGVFTKEQAHILLREGYAGSPPALKAAVAAKESQFQNAMDIVTDADKLTATELAPLIAADPDIQVQIDAARATFEAIYHPQTEQEQRQLNAVLHFVTDDIRRIYIEANAVPLPDPDAWTAAPAATKSLEEKMKTVSEALEDYQERFWDYGEDTLKRVFEKADVPNPDIQALRQRYEGSASYLAKKVATSIEKDLRNEQLEPGELGDRYLAGIKTNIEVNRGANERRRREDRKRATANERLHYNNWREKFDFTWAETPEELEDSVYDWLEFFQQQLPEEAEDKVYDSINRGLENAKSSLAQAINRLHLTENSVVAKNLRNFLEGNVAKIGAVRLVESKNGFEHYIKLRSDYAKNYVAHHDVDYLREGSAIMADFLANNNGEIYAGGPPNIIKPLSGDTQDFRGELQEKALKYGETHELYISKEDFAKTNRREIEGRVKQEMLNRSEFADLREAGDENYSIEQIFLHDTERLIRAQAAGDVEIVGKLDIRIKLFRDMLAGRFGQIRHGWSDPIEELLLEDSVRLQKADDAGDVEVAGQIDIRTKVFKGIKDELDKEDGLYRDPPDPDERKDIIRQRIIDKIRKESNLERLKEINDLPDQETKDWALWKWVEDFNRPIIAKAKEKDDYIEPWYPSFWDDERLSISSPEGAINRRLTRTEFRSMVEVIKDPYKGLTDEQIEKRITEEFRLGIQHEVLARGLAPAAAQAEFDKLVKEGEDERGRRVADTLFKIEERKIRAVRNYNSNITSDKFSGLEARWGGLTVRKRNEEGEVRLFNLNTEARDMIKKKIDKEERDIEDLLDVWKLGFVATHIGMPMAELAIRTNQEREKFNKEKKPNETAADIQAKINEWQLGFLATHPGLTPEQIEEKTKIQRRLFRRNATFGATLGLREIGMASDLPIWNYNFYSSKQMIGLFAPLVGYTDDDKGPIVELLERGRREMQAVFSFLASEYMDGKILVVRGEEGTKIADEDGHMRENHEEFFATPRVINHGGVPQLRDILEAEEMVSKSGGVKVPDLITVLADLGVYDELWENGCWDNLEWHGYLKGRNKRQLRTQSLLNVTENADPVAYVERIGGAKKALTFLKGGNVEGKGKIPGVLNEPFKGLWRYRGKFFAQDFYNRLDFRNIVSKTKGELSKYKKNVQELLDKKVKVTDVDPEHLDEVIQLGGDILEYLLDYFNSRDYVKNRAANAPKNWEYDNEIMIKGFIREFLKRKPKIAKKGDEISGENGEKIYAEGGELLSEFGGETLGDDHLAYAIQGRSALASDIFDGILRTSSYHIFDESDRRAMDGKAKRAKEKMDDKRDELMKEILPLAVRAPINAQKANLENRVLAEEQIKIQFGSLDVEGKIVPASRLEYGRRLTAVGKEIRALEVNIAKLTNQAVEDTLDSQIAAGDLKNETLRKMITGARKELVDLGADPELGNDELEVNRMIRQYIEFKVHEEITEEWPAKLVA